MSRIHSACGSESTLSLPSFVADTFEESEDPHSVPELTTRFCVNVDRHIETNPRIEADPRIDAHSVRPGSIEVYGDRPCL